MNAPFSLKSVIDEFHCERSKCIDAFIKIEAAIVGILSLTGHTCGGELFSQKLALLRKAEPNSKLSKARLAKVHGLLDRCQALAELRNDVVHSTLELADNDGTKRACFVNIRYCQADSQTARLFTIQGLRRLSADMEQLAEDLRLNPASSPLPPSQAEAGDP